MKFLFLPDAIKGRQPRRADKDWSSRWSLSEGLIIHHRKNPAYYDILHRTSDLDGFFRTTYVTRFGKWKVRDLYVAGSLKRIGKV